MSLSSLPRKDIGTEQFYFKIHGGMFPYVKLNENTKIPTLIPHVCQTEFWRIMKLGLELTPAREVGFTPFPYLQMQ